MEIKIHRGKNQIGGNIIEIATDNTKILLDIGLDLNDENNKELPKIDGLFNEKGYDAVFVSHYHGDHLGLAYQIHKDIPLFIGENSYKIIKTSDDYKNIKSISPKGFLEHKKQINIGDIVVTPYLCDHSAFDSYMILCESCGESILYTGDFRGNGRKSFDWLLKQLPSKVNTLICEGTTLSRENYIAESESSLEERTVNLIKEHNGPVFVLQSSMNIDRIVTMYRSAKRCNRIFLEELYMAEITSAIGGSIPNPSFKDIFAFITSPNRYETLYKYQNKMGKEAISQNNFVMCVRTSMLSYLKSLSNIMSFKNGLLLYSFWSGYIETAEMQKFLAVCEELGLKIVTMHTSGHADKNALKELIKTVNPTKIVPVHTENSQWFSEIEHNLLYNV